MVDEEKKAAPEEIEGAPGKQGPADPPGEARRWSAKKKAVACLAAVLVLAAACAGGWYAWSAEQGRQAEERARAEAAAQAAAEERDRETRLASRAASLEVRIQAEGWNAEDGTVAVRVAGDVDPQTPDERDAKAGTSTEEVVEASPADPAGVELRAGRYEVAALSELVASSAGSVYAVQGASVSLGITFGADGGAQYEAEAGESGFDPEAKAVTVAYAPVDMAELSDDDAGKAASASAGEGRAFASQEEARAAIDAKREEAKEAKEAAAAAAAAAGGEVEYDAATGSYVAKDSSGASIGSASTSGGGWAPAPSTGGGSTGGGSTGGSPEGGSTGGGSSQPQPPACSHDPVDEFTTKYVSHMQCSICKQYVEGNEGAHMYNHTQAGERGSVNEISVPESVATGRKICSICGSVL